MPKERKIVMSIAITPSMAEWTRRHSLMEGHNSRSAYLCSLIEQDMKAHEQREHDEKNS